MSSKAKPASKVDGLLATLKQKKVPAPQIETVPAVAPASTAPEPAAPPAAPEPMTSKGQPAPPRKETKSRAGRPVQFWIHEEDRLLLRELSAWLAGQGERPTDSMVIRSALRVTKTGGDFLKAYRQASQLDGRLKQRKTA